MESASIIPCLYYLPMLIFYNSTIKREKRLRPYSYAIYKRYKLDIIN